MSALRKPKPGIMEINPYIGGEAKIEGITRFIRLASNENALGCSPLAKAAYLGHAGELHRYPDGSAAALRTAISTTYNLDKDKIVCGAGSDELISLLIRAYAGVGDEVLYSRHGFLMYAIGAKAVGATPVYAEEQNLTADVDALLAKVTDKTKLLFLANPNNPTGSYLPSSEIKRLRENLPEHVLLVIDAAYAEFAESLPTYESGEKLVDTYGNVVMLRTFSKFTALPDCALAGDISPPMSLTSSTASAALLTSMPLPRLSVLLHSPTMIFCSNPSRITRSGGHGWRKNCKNWASAHSPAPAISCWLISVRRRKISAKNCAIRASSSARWALTVWRNICALPSDWKTKTKNYAVPSARF